MAIILDNKGGWELSEEKPSASASLWLYISGKVAASFLAFALFPENSSEFYQLLRWVVFSAAVFWVLYGYEHNRKFRLSFGLVALILWNPFVQIYLTREVWVPLDIVFGLVFWFAANDTNDTSKNKE